jgi:hypothetical protein
MTMGIRESLITRRTAIGVELEAVKNSDRHVQYKKGLYEELLSIEKLLASPTLDQSSGDQNIPFEVDTQGLT